MVKFKPATGAAVAAMFARSARRGPGTRTARPSRSTTARSSRLARNVATRLALYRKRKSNPMIRRQPYAAAGGVGTYSMFKLFRRPSPRVRAMKRVGQPNIDIWNLGEQLQVLEGFQASTAFNYLNALTVTRLFSHLPVGAPSTHARKLVVQTVTGEYILTNSSLATAYVDIYDIVRRHDANPANPGSQNPTTAWRQGVQTEAGSSALPYDQDINSLPTDSSLFNDYFRVIKRTHVPLAQGATHKHSIKYAPNMLVDEQMYVNNLGVPAAVEIAGTTIWTMIVVHGQPASIPPEGGGMATVTTAAVNIDLVYAQRIKYTWVQDINVTYYQNDNLSSLTGEYVVSAGAGTIVPNQVV